MLAIDDMTVGNGCVRYVSGSHKQGPLEHVLTESNSFSMTLDPSPDAFPEGDVATSVECSAGDAIFFGPVVIHGSHPNVSATHDRRANTFAFDVRGDNLLPAGSDSVVNDYDTYAMRRCRMNDGGSQGPRL